jgi:hypothetical protein
MSRMQKLSVLPYQEFEPFWGQLAAPKDCFRGFAGNQVV